MNNQTALTEEELVSIRLHSAGATVRHQSPFAHLPSPLNDTPMSQEMRAKWVIPFYMWAYEGADFAAACAEATPELALLLLSEFNWRPRSVGARFIAVRQFSMLQQEVSHLLLKSEVCFAGREYCIALASLGNEAAADTLSTYLDYYLRQPDLWFDQAHAMSALIYLDELLGANKASQFTDQWRQFVSDKPNWKLDNFNKRFRQEIAAVQDIRQRIALAA